MIGQVEQTRSLFAYIAERNREFAHKCFRSALPALVQGRDFALARSFISSPAEMLDRSVKQLNENIEDLPVSETESSVRLQEAYVKIYVEDISRLLEVLTNVGEADDTSAKPMKPNGSTRSPSNRLPAPGFVITFVSNSAAALSRPLVKSRT